MQVVAGVVFGQEVVGIVGIPEGGVKVDAAVDEIGGADEVIVGVAHLLTEGCVGAPAAHGQQGADVDLVAVAAGLGDVALQTLDELLHGGQVAHGAEDVLLSANGVDDVVDALLDDDGLAAGGGHLVVEAVLAGQAVAFVGQAVVLTQNTGAGGGAADDGGAAVALPLAAHGQTVGPVLGGDGVTVADQGLVLLGGDHGHVAHEVEQVGLAGIVDVDVRILGLVAVGVEAFAQGTAGEDHGTHQGEVLQVEADMDDGIGIDLHFQRIGGDALTGVQGHIVVAATEEDPAELLAVVNGDLVQGDRLGAHVVVEGQADGVADEGHTDGVADGDVLGVTFGTVLSHGNGIAPHTDPAVVFVHKNLSPFCKMKGITL